MTAAEWRIGLEGLETRAIFEPATTVRPAATFVFAHGAGGHKSDQGMSALAGRFRSIGLNVVRFNFPYRERGSGRPDQMPVLEGCIGAVVARARAELDPGALVIGGRSMGGRAASMLVAKGFACDGLLLLGYPLHPAGKPEKLRDAHLASITIPVLCINGTRDKLCDRDLMEQVLQRVGPSWTMHWLEGADHSFRVLKSSGRTDAAVLDEVAETTERWAASLR
ncbi:MAG TPA: alpha/beta family hydrolase [Gemmatimonadales bacterium]|nr:alpha/beta family hydrolase [Gemmatimonadales bacterium]